MPDSTQVPSFIWHVVEDKVPFEIKDTSIKITPFSGWPPILFLVLDSDDLQCIMVGYSRLPHHYLTCLLRMPLCLRPLHEQIRLSESLLRSRTSKYIPTYVGALISMTLSCIYPTSRISQTTRGLCWSR